MPTLKEHIERHHRIRMATAIGDWDEFDRIVDEAIEESKGKLESPDRADGS